MVRESWVSNRMIKETYVYTYGTREGRLDQLSGQLSLVYREVQSAEESLHFRILGLFDTFVGRDTTFTSVLFGVLGLSLIKARSSSFSITCTSI